MCGVSASRGMRFEAPSVEGPFPILYVSVSQLRTTGISHTTSRFQPKRVMLIMTSLFKLYEVARNYYRIELLPNSLCFL